MSKAYKCDRCGAYYSKDESNERYIIHDYNGPFKSRFIDLCDGCYAMLERFMSGELLYPEEKPCVDAKIDYPTVIDADDYIRMSAEVFKGEVKNDS
jgi:hypothetical protein